MQPLFVPSSNSTEERAGHLDNETASEDSNINNSGHTGTENRTGRRENQDITDGTSGGNTICVICQTEDVQQVFLPCRHACVCNSCFVRLDKCPLCRTDITTHFQLSCDSDAPREMIRCELDQSNMNSQSWWETFNERLNNFFGFT